MSDVNDPVCSGRVGGLSWPTRSFQSSSSVGNLRSCGPSSPAGPTTAGRPAERQVRRGTAVAVRRRPRRPDPLPGDAREPTVVNLLHLQRTPRWGAYATADDARDAVLRTVQGDP